MVRIHQEIEMMFSSIDLILTCEKTKPWVLLMFLFVKFSVLRYAKTFAERPYTNKLLGHTFHQSATNRIPCAVLARYLMRVGKTIPTEKIIQILGPKLNYLSNRTDGGNNMDIGTCLKKLENDLRLFEMSILNDENVAIQDRIVKENNFIPEAVRYFVVPIFASELSLIRFFSAMMFGKQFSYPHTNNDELFLKEAYYISGVLKEPETMPTGDFHNTTLFAKPEGTLIPERKGNVQLETRLSIILRFIETKVFQLKQQELPPDYMGSFREIKKSISEKELDVDVALNSYNRRRLILKQFVADNIL